MSPEGKYLRERTTWSRDVIWHRYGCPIWLPTPRKWKFPFWTQSKPGHGFLLIWRKTETFPPKSHFSSCFLFSPATIKTEIAGSGLPVFSCSLFSSWGRVPYGSDSNLLVSSCRQLSLLENRFSFLRRRAIWSKDPSQSVWEHAVVF